MLKNSLNDTIVYLRKSQLIVPCFHTDDILGHYIIWLDKFNHIRVGEITKISKQNPSVVHIKCKNRLAATSITPHFETSFESIHKRRILRIN